MNLTELATQKPNLSVKEFINETKFNIDKLYIDKFWCHVKNDTPILIDDEIIEWLGYEKNRLNNARKSIKRTMKNNKINFTIKKYNELTLDVIKKLLKKRTVELRYLKQKYFIFILPDDFKQLCININTTRGKFIRNFFLKIEKLLINYIKYQCICNEEKYNKIIEEIKNYKHIIKYSKENQKKYDKFLQEEKNKFGYVYFICEENNLKYFKIGFTFDLDERLQILQCGNRRKLNIYKSIKTQNPAQLENELHHKFSKYKIMGEWFNLNISQLNSI